jgi:predicted nucleic acid-binding protein
VALDGWILDKSAAARKGDAAVRAQLMEFAGNLYVCAMGELEQLYSARSADDYDFLKQELRESYEVVPTPADIFERVLRLQRDLAHHRGMWHRRPIPDLVIAETALYHSLGVVHVDRDFERIAEVRPLSVRRLG